jgi:hypothetical protein
MQDHREPDRIRAQAGRTQHLGEDNRRIALVFLASIGVAFIDSGSGEVLRVTNGIECAFGAQNPFPIKIEKNPGSQNQNVLYAHYSSSSKV